MTLEAPKYRHPDIDFQRKQYIDGNLSIVDGIDISTSVLSPKKWNYLQTLKNLWKHSFFVYEC